MSPLPTSQTTTTSRFTDTNSNGANDDNQLSETVVKAIFLLLGVGILIPWNAFVSAKPYFQARLCKDESVTVDFELLFGLIWNSSSVVSLALIIGAQALRDKYKNNTNALNSTNSSPVVTDAPGMPLRQDNNNNNHTNGFNDNGSGEHAFWLVMVPLALYMAVFSITDLLVLVPNISPDAFLGITLIGLALCGTCGAIATAGIVSTAGLFDSHVGINPFFSGQALGGVAVSVANVIAASLENPSSFWGQHCRFNNNTQMVGFERDLSDGEQTTCSPYSEFDWAVFAYFFAGCVILAGCLVGYTIIDKYQRMEHRDDYEPVNGNVTQVADESPRIGLEMKTKDRLRERQALNEPTESYHDEYLDESLSVTQSRDGLLVEPNTTTLHPSELLHYPEIHTADVEEYTEEEDEVAVFSAIKGPASCIFITFTVTLCLFPGWISKLRSTHECESHSRMNNDLYVPFSFVVFNIGDLTGRLLSGKVPVQRIRHMSLKLVLAAVGRIIFVPLLLICTNGNKNHHLGVIESDLYSLVVQFLFAFTNGILISCSFMHAPHLVAHTTGMQERASEMMTFAVYFGLLSGSLLSFPFSELSLRL